MNADLAGELKVVLPQILMGQPQVVRGWLQTQGAKPVLTLELQDRPPDVETAGRFVRDLAVALQEVLGEAARGLGIGAGAARDVGEPAAAAVVVFER